jgi:AraC-like DNA-binding protein
LRTATRLLPEKWIERLKLFTFKYKDGFFELSFISDSPELMLESLKSMPFCSFDGSLNKITARSMFIEAEVYAECLSDGLVLVYTDARYKKNIIYNQVFQKGTQSQSYSINYFLTEIEPLKGKTIIEDVHFDGRLWTFVKPKSKIKNYHFAGSQSISVNLFFSEEWFIKFSKLNFKEHKRSMDFIQSTASVITSKCIPLEQTDSFLKMIAHAMHNLSGVERKQILDQCAHQMLLQFDKDCLQEISNQASFAISNSDRIKLNEIEQLLNAAVYHKFPGIDQLAKKVSFSPTKLKYLFKQVYGVTLMQYFTTLKMKLAYETISKMPSQINEIATLYGYENASKFAASFKK